VQSICCEALIVGSNDDGMLGTFRFLAVPMTGWYDGFSTANASRVLVLARTRGTKLRSGELSAWHLKQTSYSYITAATIPPFLSIPRTPRRRPEA
jgi:hypothetical protein